jgi:hypothetical protein
MEFTHLQTTTDDTTTEGMTDLGTTTEGTTGPGTMTDGTTGLDTTTDEEMIDESKLSVPHRYRS